jgi:peroxiredoxin
MKNFQANLQRLEATDTQVLGVSMDSPFANKAFADSLQVTFPLLSDWFNGGSVTRAYGAYSSKYMAARRITYLIDKSGKILEIQMDKDAIDPAHLVQACERRRLKH